MNLRSDEVAVSGIAGPGSGTPLLKRTTPSLLAGWRHLNAFLLSLMVVSITAANLLWVGLDSGRTSWDPARHLGDSLFYFDTFSLADPIQYLEGYVRYPPLMYWVTDAFYAVFGTELWVAILSNTVFLSILVFATYGIGKTLWSPRVGLLAAFFAVTSPMFVTQLKWYMLDAPLSALVALGLYYLIRSDNFADRRSSLLLGVACGCGLLIKWTYPFFLALPVAVAAVAALIHSRRQRSAERLFNLAGAGLLTVGLSALWYLPNYNEFRADVDASTALPASIQGDPPVGSLDSALWYFWGMVNDGLFLVPFLFFAAGIVFVFLKDQSASKNMPLVLSLIGSYVAISAIALKDVRYAMPMIASIAVIGTGWLQFLKPSARRWLSGGLIAYGALAFLVISFGADLLPKEIRIPDRNLSTGAPDAPSEPADSSKGPAIVFFSQRGYVVSTPSDEEWRQEDLFEEMTARVENPTFWFTEPRETVWFTTWGIRYFAFKHDAIWVGAPAEAQFLIIRGPPPEGATAGFAQIKQWPLPDEGPVTLYQRL